VHHDAPPQFYASADGGKTWTDRSAGIYANADVSKYRFSTGFALDAKNVWLGGDSGTLLYSSTGGE
jgi:hypothetical protein